MAVASVLLMSTFTMAAAQDANPEKLSVEPVTVTAGEETEVTVNYESEVERSGFQIDVILPEGLSFVKAMNEDEEEVVMTLGSSATKTHQASEGISKENPQQLTLVVFDLKKKALKNGVLFTFKVKADETLPETSEIKFERIKFNGGQYLDAFTCAVTNKIEPKDVVVAPEANSDIAAAVAEAIAGVSPIGSITINLEAGATYTVNSSIEVPCGLVINGNGATVDASALEGPMIKMSETPAVEANEAGFYPISDVVISGVNVTGLTQQLFYANKVKYLMDNLTCENSVIQIAGGSKTVFDFNGGGVTAKLDINNSTIYAIPANTGALYSSQSGQKAIEAGLEKQTISIVNSTISNIANGKNFCSHRQSNQTWLEYVVNSSIFLDCGKKGQVIMGLNGGQNGKKPTWAIDKNTFLWTVDGVVTDSSAEESTGDDEEPVANSLTTNPTFADAANGDFTIGASTQQAEFKTGDSRWVVEYVALDKAALEAEIATATELLGEASTEEGTPGAALKAAIDEANATLASAVSQDEIDKAVETLKAAEKAYNEATGISDITSGAAEGGAWYNMQGVKVEKPAQKGVYIHNGKKIVVR